MDFGRLCISRAVADKDLGAVLERGLTPEMMPTPEDGMALSFLIDFHKKHRAVPSPQVMEKQFPDYKLGYASDPASYYVDCIIQQHVRAEVQDAMLTSARGVGGDPFAVIDGLKGKFGKLVVLSGLSQERDISESTAERLAEYERRKNAGGLLGIPTPWSSLDDLTGGWEDEMYVGIAARPKTGKTWFLLRIAHKAWKEGYRVLFFNKENRTDIMERRFDAIEYGLPYKRLKDGMLTDAEEKRYRKGLDKLANKPPKNWLKFIHGSNSIGEVQAKVEELEPDLVLIDGAYLYVPENTYGREHELQKRISREIKAMSQATKKPTIITIQLNRGGDAKNRTTRGQTLPLSLSDVAGSDAFAQDVDLLLGLEQTEDMRASAELDVWPLAVREAEPNPFRVGWDFDSMKSEDKGLATSVYEGDDEEEEILDITS